MINFITHPALTNLLEQSRVKMKYLRFLVDIVIVSDFLPQHPNSIHSGLLEAVKYRLAHPAHYILLLSFHSKEDLLPYDTLGILSLQGTVFIRLPFLPEQLFTVIGKYTDNEFAIPKTELLIFSTIACKALLKEKISVFNHGSQYDFGNSVTFALRAACVGSITYPAMLPLIKEHLESVKKFIALDPVSEFLSLANMAGNLNDSFLLTVVNFSEQLVQLSNYEVNSDKDVKQLIFIIDKLNDSASEIGLFKRNT